MLKGENWWRACCISCSWMLTNIMCRRWEKDCKKPALLTKLKKMESTLLQKLSQIIASKWDLETLFMWTCSVILAGGLDQMTKRSLPAQTIPQLLCRSRTRQLSPPSFPLLRKDHTNIWKSGSDKAQIHTAKRLAMQDLCEGVWALLSIQLLPHLSVPVLPSASQGHCHVPVPPYTHPCSQFCSTSCSNYLCSEAPTLWVGGLQHWAEKVVRVQKVSALPVSPSCEKARPI